MLLELAKKRFKQLSFLSDSARLVRDPHDLKAIIRLADGVLEMAGPEDVRRFSELLCKDKVALSAVESRYRVNPDPAPLRKLPEGTLGRVYAQHLDRNGITPESLKPTQVIDDLTYVSAHLYETHDIWHAVTGFGTSVAHELGLAAFGSAQIPSHFELILLGGGLLNTALYAFDDRRPRMNAIARGWRMGKRAKPLFGQHWDELWAEPIDEVRAMLGIRVPQPKSKRAPSDKAKPSGPEARAARQAGRQAG